MLPAGHRLRRRADFAQAIRRGRRAGVDSLVVHLLVQPDDGPVLAGFAVNRAVGGAVVRNRVTRRLRALVAERLERLPAGSRLVVRALPTAASATYAELGADLDRGLDRVLR